MGLLVPKFQWNPADFCHALSKQMSTKYLPLKLQKAKSVREGTSFRYPFTKESGLLSQTPSLWVPISFLISSQVDPQSGNESRFFQKVSYPSLQGPTTTIIRAQHTPLQTAAQTDGKGHPYLLQKPCPQPLSGGTLTRVFSTKRTPY
ncbi:hypothetical protein KIL84_011671 [Mauremys mutica]|uniref:Uncharacterized protein n=1 Tax=Mauremys mutica TaxID=74926 RepID=A0A9D3XA35_9SAUR|nr:hypothetical protein KIL84_011671 [Mauremys mutica]